MKGHIPVLCSLIFLICWNNSYGQGNLVIDEGTVLNISEGTAFTIRNTHLINHGDLISENSTLHLMTRTGDISLEGNAFSVANLAIEAREHTVNLATTLEVREELKLVSGILDLRASELLLGESSGRITGETNQNRITASDGGEVVKIAELISPNRNNPGNLGIEITCNENLGRTEIRRGHIPSSLPSGMSVARYFRVIPGSPVSQNVQLRFYFLDAEKNEETEKHQIWKKSRNRWQSLKTEALSAPTDPMSNWVSGSDFELAPQYIVGPEQQLEESLGSIPSAFTPNADGVNDYFEIPWIQNHPEAQVSIFDRWGELIFRETGYHRTPWNGKHKGKTLPSSTFFYIIRFPAGKAPLKGKISIVR